MWNALLLESVGVVVIAMVPAKGAHNLILSVSDQLLSHVQCFAASWTAAHQGLLSVELLEQLAISSSGDIPNPRIEPVTSVPSALQG